ncbi:tRNA 2-selenouridine(34) synthase MnmH [Synechococcus sp. GFB01]|uniref:tRNA 2-selenouridine(34) synthase MnmH n=1 Tax=Synechococcus sp. GFB01 TaxID=1662190 RepID=UPI00064E511B|nr:tRNA 2-selenouridine(34) synthase MnmH [Synechococcus sp. GFB01]KMM17722.1 tRNA 2-selenouridine synthase [Synechococcus sp. GFB01]
MDDAGTTQPGAELVVGVEDFLNGRGSIVDVRSPAEFERGHLPGAVNLPLFSDAERAAVGTAFRQEGRRRAVQLGLEMVGPRLAAMALELSGLADAAGQLRVHCWRGGLRSTSVAWLAGLQQLRVWLLGGGYKAYRRWVLEQMERPWPLIVLGGRTGTGKTDLLLALERRGAAVVDLEGLAQHRGSSFGGLGLPAQPSTEQFENRLADRLRRLRGRTPIWVEAESAQVGRCRIPAAFWRQMREAAVVEIDRPVAVRVSQLVAVYGPQGKDNLRQATERIARRLGPQRTTAALAAIDAGDWASACREMLDYYDRCYDHELHSRGQPPLQRLELGEMGAEQAAVHLMGVSTGAA